VNGARLPHIFVPVLYVLLLTGCVQLPGNSSQDKGQAGEHQIATISPDEVRKCQQEDNDCLLIDTRSSEEYLTSHLPGAHSLPGCGRSLRLEKLPAAKDRRLVLYCGWAGCCLEHTDIQPIIKAGYNDVRIMRGGMEAWIRAGYPTVPENGRPDNGKNKSPQSGQHKVELATFKKAVNGKIKATILDVRTNEEREGGSLRNSIHIPLAELAQRLRTLPSGARIFVYGTSWPEAELGTEILTRNGFQAAFLASGVECEAQGCHFTPPSP